MTENKKSRMYEADGKTVRTWNVFKGCNFDCAYCVQREQAKRQKHRCVKCYNYEPHLHSERLGEKFKAGETVFVVAAGDISFASFEEFNKILEVTNYYLDTTFYIQSKNPAYFNEYIERHSSDIGGNIVFGTTIETNYTFPLAHCPRISKAPLCSNRKNAMVELRHHKSLNEMLKIIYHQEEPSEYVTIEPTLLFDVSTMVEWIKAISPVFVYVGYLDKLSRAKKLQLPEPPLVKVKELCQELAKFTEVREKTMRNPWWWDE